MEPGGAGRKSSRPGRTLVGGQSVKLCQRGAEFAGAFNRTRGGKAMRKFLLLAATVATTGLVVVAAADAATPPGQSFRGYTPFQVSGNPDCKDLAGMTLTRQTPDGQTVMGVVPTSANQARFAPPVNGATDGHINLSLNSDPGVGWWVSNDDVDTVIVKGGPNANVYIYPGGDFSDGSLTAPANKGGQPAAIGSVTVCYNPLPSAT
jgi:hypothetical protein